MLSATMTATAPAAWAFCVCCWNVQRGGGGGSGGGGAGGAFARSTTAIAPAGSGPYGLAPVVHRAKRRRGGAVVHEDDRAADASVRGRRTVARPAGSEVAGAVHETWFWSPNVVVLPGQRYICIRGTPVPGVGSVGVEKLALFVPDPSWASQRT